MKFRLLDYILLAIIFWLGANVWLMGRIIDEHQNRYQINSNYVSNLTECMDKTVLHDWMFQQSGITDILKSKYPGMFK